MRALALFFFTVLAVGCSSASSDVPDAAESHDSGQGMHHGDGGQREASATVCSPPPADAGVEAGADAAHDASTEAHSDGATDAATHASDAGDAATSCVDACVLKYPAPYQKFVGYQLMECGCTATGACYSDCHDSTTLAATSACGMCLAAQGAEGLASTCTLAAAGDCSMDVDCSAFQACAGMCPM
jgi:hypothetical protein